MGSGNFAQRFPFSRGVAFTLSAAMFFTSLPVPQAQAGLVATQDVVQADLHRVALNPERDRVMTFLAREDVRREMISLGIDPAEASQRVKHMSDSEIAALSGRLGDVPAGGDAISAVIGAAVLVFIILLITDIAGLTKVFPFTREIRSQ